MKDVFPERKLPILLATFLIPSLLYWTSGLHKEGLFLRGIGLVIYHIYFGLKEEKFSSLRVIVILLGLLLVLAFRNFLIIPILPALLAWILASQIQS